MNRRAVSPVVGLALLVGLIAMASLSLLVASTAITDNTKQSIDHQQAAQSLNEFAQSATEIAKGESDEAQFSIDGADGGTIRSMPYDGDQVHLEVIDENGSVVFSTTKTMGSVVYGAPDGSQLAFQGGGVWRVQEDGEAVMESPPPFHYRHEPDPTLTYPLTLVRDDFSGQGSVTGTMRVDRRDRHYPDEPSHYNPLYNGSVVIEIDSLYCEGWEDYLKHRTDGSVTEGCGDRGITNESEVRMVLSVPFELNGLGGGASFEDTVDDDKNINGSYEDGGHSMESPTRVVNGMIEDCEEHGTDLDGNTTIDEPGLYCADDDEMTGDKQYEIDASEGEVEIAVDGDVYDHIQGEAGIEITGSENVTIFVNGDLFTGDGQPNKNQFGNESDPNQLRFFVASGNKVGDNSNIGKVYALIYAPTCDVDLQGNFYFEGAIVGESVDLGGSGELRVDEDASEIDFHYQPEDANIYYLHVSEAEIVFE